MDTRHRRADRGAQPSRRRDPPNEPDTDVDTKHGDALLQRLIRSTVLNHPQKTLEHRSMKIFIRLILSVLCSFVACLIVAGLFLPIYGIFEGGPHNCLTTGLNECISTIPLSMLIYGPLFSIFGILIGTPIFLIIFSLGD